MKLLVDSCVSGSVASALTALGHDAASIAELPDDPGDRAVFAIAQREGRTLVTLDKDFGEFSVLEGLSHCGLVRLVDLPSSDHASRCHAALVAYGPVLQLGGIVTVERARMRVRQPEQTAP